MNQPVQKGSLWNNSSPAPETIYNEEYGLWGYVPDKDIFYGDDRNYYQREDGKMALTPEASAAFARRRADQRAARTQQEAPAPEAQPDEGMQPPESDAPWRDNLGPAPAPTEMPPELQSPYEAAGEQYMNVNFDSSWAKDLTGGMEELAHAMGKNRSRGSRRFGMERQYPDVPGMGARAENEPVMTMPQTSRPGSLM